MREAVIVDAVRTPVAKGKPGGALYETHPVDATAHVLRALVERNGIDPAQIDDVLTGVVGQAGDQALNLSRNAALAAGYPEQVPAVTIDRQCGSSQQAATFGAQGVMTGSYDLVVAAGVESMSRVPMGSALMGRNPFGEAFGERYPGGLIPQGVAAERIALKWGLSREQLDELALRSHQLAAAAEDAGAFASEIVPIEVGDGQGGTRLFDRDEGIRRETTLEALAGLKPAFFDTAWEERFPGLPWVVTAGNSSPINDGASAVLIASPEKARELGLRPRARFHTFAVTGDDPLMMLTAVIPVTFKAIERSGLTLDDIDLFEVNEAFASVVGAWQAETGVPWDKVNVNGGAMAIGHPLGSSGTRLLGTLVNALEQRGARYGMQVMCEAGGLANATIVERL
ncbi:MAG TPA: thiolase family protein [Egibacteraceae bacterium]|nr:thiolase family protein [Egibacteraceae bacterium]